MLSLRRCAHAPCATVHRHLSSKLPWRGRQNNALRLVFCMSPGIWISRSYCLDLLMRLLCITQDAMPAWHTCSVQRGIHSLYEHCVWSVVLGASQAQQSTPVGSRTKPWLSRPAHSSQIGQTHRRGSDYTHSLMTPSSTTIFRAHRCGSC